MPRVHSAERGVLVWELVVAIAMLVGVMFPLCLIVGAERKALRAGYHRALAIELVDGEMEILAAGEWRAFRAGPQPYRWHAGAATNLPPGQLTLTLEPRSVRLEWRPDQPFHGGRVFREANLP